MGLPTHARRGGDSKLVRLDPHHLKDWAAHPTPSHIMGDWETQDPSETQNRRTEYYTYTDS